MGLSVQGYWYGTREAMEKRPETTVDTKNPA